MVAQRLADEERSYVVLDDRGRPIGRVDHTECHLDERPPPRTVFLHAIADGNERR